MIPDHEGVELPDDLAEEIIVTILEEMRSEEPELFDGDSKWFIEIVDDSLHFQVISRTGKTIDSGVITNQHEKTKASSNEKQ